MSKYAIIKNCRKLVEHFTKNDAGNIAVIFALAMLPILTFVGAAIDYTRASSARSAMQSALDSTSLMVLKDVVSGAIATSDISVKAQSYFSALYKNKNASEVSISTTYTPQNSSGKSTILVNGSAQVTTDFLKVAGYSKLGINMASTATMGGTRFRVAMALDVTGSMNDDGKLAAMKSAAKNLVLTLRGLGNTADDVYISVVPFAQMVNVDVANKDASWLKWSELGSCSSSNLNYAAYMSRFNTRSGCQANGGTWTSTINKTNWKGCVTDRDQPYDTTKDAPVSDSTDFPAAFYTQNGADICPSPLLFMTSTYTDASTKIITDKISSLVAAGGTNQPIGIDIAWHTLQSYASPPKDPNFKYTDVVIVLSDGLNTIDRWYGNGTDVSSDVDARQKILCQNINNQSPTVTQDYAVYTIQVNTDGDPESAPLKACASRPNNFYPTSTAAGISEAFYSIGTSLSKLRVSQ